MTNLRDARFQRALDAAPDAQLRPDARMRAQIREAAREAALSQHRKWWKATGSVRPAWGAAFASIALATLVTLLWYDREIPDAGVTSPSAGKQAPAPVRPASSVAQPPPVALPASPAPAPSPAVVGESRMAKPAGPTRQEPATDAAKEPAKELAKTGPPSGGALNGGSLKDVPLKKDDAMRDRAAPALSNAAPTAPAVPAAAAAAAKAETAAPVPSPAPLPAPAFAPPRPAAAPAPAPVTPSMARESAAGLRANAAAVDDNWSEASVQARGRSVRVQRALADRLPSLLAAITRSPAAPPVAVAAQAALQVDLTGPGGTDTFEVVGTQVRWTRVRDGQPRQVTMLTPDAAALQALQAEADRLLAR